MNLQIQRMAERHVRDVSQIEFSCFEDPWGIKALKNCLFDENVTSVVATDRKIVVAHMCLSIRPKKIDIYRLAILPDCQRQGIGRMLVGLLTTDSFSPTMHDRVETWVNEYSLEAQLFFKACGFVHEGTVNSIPADSDDGYLFARKLKCKSFALQTAGGAHGI
jgi:ribosomal protein S18 acetylase RimI-like enzyme